MRRFLLLLFVLCGLVATAAASEIDLLPLGDPDRAYLQAGAMPGEIVDTSTGEVVSVAALAEHVASARVILLGEEHTHLGQKHRIAEILNALAEVQPNLVLGMEFFLEEDRELLAQWGRGEIGGDTFLREVGWYDRGAYRWGYYEPIMEVARRRSIPVVGLNVPREIPRAVNRGGLASLTDEQRARVGVVEVEGSPQHRYLIGRYFGDTIVQMPPRWFDNMYAAQCLWDTVMARSILKELPEDGALVVVVGSGHVAYDLGIGRRIADERRRLGEPDLEVVTYCPIQAPIPDPDGEGMGGHPMGGSGEQAGGAPAVFSRSLADFVAVFENMGGVEAWPTMGLRLKEGDGGVPVVSIAWPDSRAAEAGFETGDVIVDLNGETPADLADFRMMLARLEWGERVDVQVRRNEQTLHLVSLLVPDPVKEEREVAPGWMVEPAAAFDPASAIAVSAGDSGEETVHSILEGELGSWVVARADGVPVHAYELDEALRVSRSLHLEPLADGAVELRYRRDDDGMVVSTERLDRTGRPVME
jgi:uncharacterized iron-regulated protein